MCAFPRLFLSERNNYVKLRAVEGYLKIKIEGNNLNNLCYANDIVLIAENQDLQHYLTLLKRKIERFGIEQHKDKNIGCQ